MIARLTGLLDALDETSIVIDVSGVGYLVFCSATTLRGLGSIGDPVRLSIETHVREDHIHLYGFATQLELEMFRLLLGVQGVGTKVALSILTVLDPDALLVALASGDKEAVTGGKGVGPKLAARIINELKDKVGGFAPGGSPAAGGVGYGADFQDALSALVQLGYKPSTAHTALLAASGKAGAGADIASLIKGGLRELSR